MKRDLGNMIKTLTAIAPQTIGAVTSATAASVATGVGIDRLGYESVVFSFINSLPAGVPLATTLTCIIEESADNVTYTAVSGASAVHNVTVSASVTEVSIPDATALDRYVRGRATVLFASGSGCYTTVGAIGILGSSVKFPV